MEELYTNLLQECVHWAASFIMGVTERFSNQVLTGLLCVYFLQHKEKMLKIQGDSILGDITAGDDFIGLYDQKS